MALTDIEWSDYVWNPIRGCSMAKGSELGGCLYCYAARQAARNLPGMRSPTTGSPFAIMTDNGPRWTGKVELIESKLTEPLHWKKPRRVFVNSMSDLFHENLPDEAIDRVFAVMALTPHITYQVLTKRARRMREWFDKPYPQDRLDAAIAALEIEHREEFQWPLPNLWLGVSVENQPTADERLRELMLTPAALRFVSDEPCLADIDFRDFLGHHLGCDGEAYPCKICGAHGKLGWGIVGGESGPDARPFNLVWARNTIQQFKAAGVPLFVKQLGSDPYELGIDGRRVEGEEADADAVARWRDDRSVGIRYGKPKPTYWISKLNSKGGNWDEWPTDLRVRQIPGEAALCRGAGK